MYRFGGDLQVFSRSEAAERLRLEQCKRLHKGHQAIALLRNANRVVHLRVAVHLLIERNHVVSTVCEQEANCKRTVEELREDQEAVAVRKVMMHSQGPVAQALAVAEQHGAEIARASDGRTIPIDQRRATKRDRNRDPTVGGKCLAVDAP